MGFRFFRRMNIAPGVRLNFSKSGISPSFGVRGARVTLGRSGIRQTVGLPGTGLFYTRVSGSGGGRSRSNRSRQTRVQPPPAKHSLDLNFLQRMTMPGNERAFVEGCRAYINGKHAQALESFRNAEGIPDADFITGFMLIDKKQLPDAKIALRTAAGHHTRLGRLFGKYGIHLRITLPITPEYTAEIEPCLRGALLGLAEIHQLLNEPKEALRCLRRIERDGPGDVVVRLSIAELLLEMHPQDRRTAREVIELASDVSNDSEAHAALLLFKARALRILGLSVAARDTLTASLRKRSDRGDELLRALRYERALVYESLGQKARARGEFEKLFAEDPGYEDVARRLGVP